MTPQELDAIAEDLFVAESLKGTLEGNPMCGLAPEHARKVDLRAWFRAHRAARCPLYLRLIERVEQDIARDKAPENKP